MTDPNNSPFDKDTHSSIGESDLPGHFQPLRSPELASKASLQFDLKDAEQIRDYLSSFDSFADAPAEAHNYVNHALRRFLITVDMVPKAIRPDQRLLEIGGSPYYVTLLLQRFRDYEIYLTNFFGDDYPHTGQQVITSRKYNEAYVSNFINVNVEKDLLPYPDNTFDIVLFCEVVEHLTQDPTFALVEFHRVLKPGGYLLVTTPNVFRWQHLIYLLYKSHNLFHPYSGHGVYGRHQREYSPTELTDLVQGCGFKAVRTEIADFEECNKWSERIAKRLWPLRRDNIFLLAQREAKRCFYYPSWLYIATQNIHRVIDSDVRMGINDVGHLGRGWWDAEPIPGGHARWTMDEARIYLARPDVGGHEIVVEATGMVTALGPISVTLMVGQHERQFRMTGDEWRQLVLSWSGESDAGEVTLGIRVEPTRVPKERSVNADTRALGLMVRRIYIR